MSSKSTQFLEIFRSIDFKSIKDHPNILIAAAFWEEERYCAAKICYRFMRKIDDLIDDYKATNEKIAPDERKDFMTYVNNWLHTVIKSAECNPDQKELLDIIGKFRIPVWPIEAFARSMIYDINNDGFATLDDFITYSQGASVAPASIFVHLNGLTGKNGIYEPPAFNVRETATPCAIFSYLVHIIRDFRKDQKNNLNYFADDLLRKHSLSRSDLRIIAETGNVTRNFRELIEEYYELADEYRARTLEIIKKITPSLEPRYQLSLRIIFDLYMMVFERIDLKNGKFSTEELNPTPEETRERVYRIVADFPGKDL